MNKMLIIVDVQNDFGDGGPFFRNNSANKNKEFAEKINAQMDNGNYNLIVATQDWHPENHVSFARTHNKPEYSTITLTDSDGYTCEQTLWPVHCVQGAHGAEFLNKLNQNKFNIIVRKGTSVNVDSYSALFENAFYSPDKTKTKRKPTYFGNLIKGLEGEWQIDVCGVATDGCVKATAEDLKMVSEEKNITIAVIANLCKTLTEEAHNAALEEMRNHGILII